MSHISNTGPIERVKEKGSTEEIITVQVKYTGNKIIYKRTYPKIQDLLAQISGFVTIVIPIFALLVLPYARLQTVQHLMNETYEIKYNRNKNNKQGKPLAKKKSKASKLTKYQQKTDPKHVAETEAELLPNKKESSSRTLSNSKTKNLEKKAEEALGPLHTSLYMGANKNASENVPIIKEEIQSTLPKESLNKSPSIPLKSSEQLPPKTLENDNEPLQDKEKTFTKEEEEEAKEEQIYQQENELSDPLESESEPEEEEDIPIRTSDTVKVEWTDWLRSFFKTQPQVEMLKQAEEHIMETIDLVTLSKKVVEIDKLKACLLTNDQRVIFDNLPPSMIIFEPNVDVKPEKSIRQYHWKGSYKGDEDELREAYLRMKKGKGGEKMDKRLISLYESEYLDDERIQRLGGAKSL